MTTLSGILQHKVVAIIRGTQPHDIVNIAQALLEGGIKVMEVTLNSPKALSAIEKLSDAMGDQMLVGAGTVLDPESARAALLAGAKFIISPALNIETIKMTKRYGAVSIPGAYTPTEILTAYENGGDIIKLFPASVGPNYLKEVSGPLPYIPIMPTGGVTLENLADYKKAGAVAFGIGSALVSSKEEINDAYLKKLAEKAKQYMDIANQ